MRGSREKPNPSGTETTYPTIKKHTTVSDLFLARMTEHREGWGSIVFTTMPRQEMDKRRDVDEIRGLEALLWTNLRVYHLFMGRVAMARRSVADRYSLPPNPPKPV